MSNVKCQMSNGRLDKRIWSPNPIFNLQSSIFNLQSLLWVLAGLLWVSCQTPDTTRPSVLSIWPRADTTGVPLDAKLQIEFSEPMDQTATELSFQFQPEMPATFIWNGDNSLFFAPNWNLAPLTKYSITIGIGAQDLAGNALDAPFTASFTTGDSSRLGVQVYMLGRSVMNGWFNHWGSDPFFHKQYALRYREVDAPPDIVGSVRTIIDTLSGPEGSVLFFKLCFDDFAGGDQAAAQANLDRNLEYVQQVYDTAVRTRHLRLIIGNALPKVAKATDQWLVWNHRQYNARLSSFAGEHDSVQIFDLYSILSETSGALKSKYATSADDSHPNDAGYTALDRPFFTLLEQYY